jgi:hypothetical protein
LANICSSIERMAAGSRLASGAAEGLGTYIRQLQDQRQVPAAQRVEIRQLGQPAAKVVNDGVGLKMGVLIFALVFLAWCAGILIVSRLVQNWKTAGRLAEQGEGVWPATAPREPEPEPEPADDDQGSAERRTFERTS